MQGPTLVWGGPAKYEVFVLVICFWIVISNGNWRVPRDGKYQTSILREFHDLPAYITGMRSGYHASSVLRLSGKKEAGLQHIRWPSWPGWCETYFFSTN